jgi:hypothetical protein
MRHVEVIEKEDKVLLIVSESCLPSISELFNLLPLSKTKSKGQKSKRSLAKNASKKQKIKPHSSPTVRIPPP